jgi:putative ABC transport system permease protein
MSNWLDTYAYHVSLDWTVFALPAVATLLIALLVISREVIKASLVNPVNSLKSD